MELNEVVLTELPDDTIYHLLTLCSLEQVLRFQRVLGKQRKSVFREVEKFFGEKYGLYDLSLSQIYSVVSKEDKEESAMAALALGDFPKYIESIYDEIELHGKVKRHRHESKGPGLKRAFYTEDHAIDRIYKYAWYNRLEDSVLVMLKRKPDPVGHRSIFGIMNARYRKLLLYMVENYDFSSIVIDDTIVFSKGVPSRKALLWALETANPIVSEKLITHILSNRADVLYDEVLHLEMMEALLERASDEDVRIAYRKHLERPKLYQHEEVTELFKERLGE